MLRQPDTTVALIAQLADNEALPLPLRLVACESTRQIQLRDQRIQQLEAELNQERERLTYIETRSSYQGSQILFSVFRRHMEQTIRPAIDDMLSQQAQDPETRTQDANH